MRLPAWVAGWLLMAMSLGAETEETVANLEQGGRKNITLGAMFQEEFRQHERLAEFRRRLWRLKVMEAVVAGLVGLLVSFLLDLS